MPLNLALKVSDAVKELGGARSAIQKSLLAKHLGESEKSPTFSQRITAAKNFDLISGHGSYSLTEKAKQVYFPTSETGKSSALLAVFESPSAFKELIRRFDGDVLPSREILGNILHRDLNVPESWKERVAAFFVNSAQFVGAIDGQGFLRFKAAQQQAPDATVATNGNSPPILRQPVHEGTAAIVRQFYQPRPTEETNVWSFSHKGKSVRLETPTELDKHLWEKLSAYVRLLNPDEGGGT